MVSGHRVALDYPLWVSEPELCRAVTGAPTLRAGLEILCQLANGISTACSYGFRSIDGQWLLYGVKLDAVGRTEVTLYELTALTQIVQLLAVEPEFGVVTVEPVEKAEGLLAPHPPPQTASGRR